MQILTDCSRVYNTIHCGFMGPWPCGLLALWLGGPSLGFAVRACNLQAAPWNSSLQGSTWAVSSHRAGSVANDALQN